MRRQILGEGVLRLTDEFWVCPNSMRLHASYLRHQLFLFFVVLGVIGILARARGARARFCVYFVVFRRRWLMLGLCCFMGVSCVTFVCFILGCVRVLLWGPVSVVIWG